MEIQVSELLDVTADDVSVDVAPGSFGMTVGSATVSVPKLAGFQGSVQDLAITSDGFSIGKATLGFTGTITLGSVLTISNPSASLSGLSFSIQGGAQFNGDISFGLSASLKVGGVASASVSGLEVTLGLTPHDYGQFEVTANSASFALGSYLTLTATSTPTTPLEFNTAATSGQDIVQFGTVTAQLNAGPLSVTATGQDFGINSKGNFVALTGFGIQASASVAGGIDAAGAFKWPTWLPIQVSKLALTWPDFNDDPSNFSIDISAGINTSLAGLTLSGNVQDAVFNVEDLVNGQFPLTSLGGAGFQVGGTFAGVTFNAEGFLATTTGANGQTILYGGIDGGVSIAGLAGFQIMLGLSSLGPLDIYAMVDAPIILDPDTGLAITGLSAGINFGGGLATPDSAKDLGQVAQSVFAPTLSQWESQLTGDVADQISSGASWTNPPTLLTIQGGATLFDAYASPDAFELSGNIAFDTTGKLLASGTLVMGASIDVQGSAFIDLSQVASGKAVLMLNVDTPANTPIVTAYGTVDFQFDGPVFNATQVPTGSSTPQLGNGLALDGSTGYGSAPNIDLNDTSYTVEFWAQRSATGREEYVIGQGPSTSTTGLSIGFDTNNDFVVNSGGTTLSFPAGQDTSWHQWAVAFDMASGTLSIYRDGVLENSASKVEPIQGASSTLLLGKSGSIFFGGGVDEVRVWTVARTTDQIENNLALQTLSPTTGLLADWSFSEGQGTTAADSSGHGNTMTLTGGASWAPTVIGGTSRLPAGLVTAETASAVELDGTDSYASASGINLNDSSFSIEFWAKQNDTARLEYIINQGDPTSSGGLQIGFDANNNLFVSMGGTTLTTPTNDNCWHEWAVTFDSTSGQLMIYQDGVPAASTTANPISIAGSTPAFLIGKSGSFYFDGDITQVRVWTVVRTETDINSDMVSSTPKSTIGLLAAWNFSEGTGTTAADSSGNGHDATINGGTRWITATLPTIPTPPFEGFTITISGGIDLTVPDVPGGLKITGTASFRVDASAGSLQLNVSGMVDLAPLGNALDLEGVVHFDLGPEPYSDPKPEFYGIFVLQTGQLFNTLSSIGLNVNGMAVLRFNTTSSDIPIDLPIPNSDPTQPATLQNFVIQADAVSLMIQGDVNFQLQGTQWFGLSGTFDAIFQDPNNQPELDILENASLIIGPPDSPIVEFDTTGFLRLWSGGVAAQFLITFDARDSSVLDDAGIDFSSPIDPLTGKPVVNRFEFELNTSGQAVSFTAPTLTSSDPGLTGDSSGLTINIPAGAPQPDGSTAAPGQYMVVEGSGGFELDKSFAVIGSFYLEVTPSQLLLETDAQLFLQVQGNTLLNLQANGGIDISNLGIYGAIQLTLNAGLPAGYGFSLNAAYLLEVNTTSQTQTIAGIVLPAGPFAEIKATGDLDVGSFDLSGSFVFEVDSTSVMIALNAQAALGPLGQADINGDLVIQGGSSSGIYGILQSALATSPDIPDVGLNVHFQFEINTTNVDRTVTGFTVDQTTGQITIGQQITIDAGTIQFDAGGNLTIVNIFDVAGQFDFTLGSSGVQIDAHAALKSFFGLNLGLSAQFDLTSGGLAVNAGLSLNESLPLGLLSISASPQLLINTTGQTLDGVAPGTYEVELNDANVNFLGLQASGTLIVGVSDGIFEIDVPSSNPLQLSFFGLGGVSISGYIDSNGQFSLTGSLGFQLGQSGNEIWGSLQITISNDGFSGYFGGGCQIFGINVASVSGWLTIDNGYIDLGASVSVWVFSFGFNIGIGQLQEPQNAPYSLLFYSVPTTSEAGSTISLNASATDGSGNVAGDGAYNWTIYYDNAVYAQETGANPNLKLGDPGTYTIDMNEGSVSKSSTIQVADVPPTVSSLNLQTGYAEGQSVTLAPSVYSPLPEAPGGLHYQWTILKDGQPFATANTPTYTFTPSASSMTSEGAPVPDVYQVSLTVSDNYGGSTTASGSFGTFDPNNIVVTTTQDLTSPGNVTSLRVAIQEAESNPGVHYVKFASDLAGQTIALTNIDDGIDDGNSAIRIPGGTVVLDASNAPGVTIAAVGATRIFYVPQGSTLELEDLNLNDGYEIGTVSGAYGGAIYADGAVYASNCAFVNNTAVGDYYDVAGGGAIYVSTTGYLSAIETTFGDNSADGYQRAMGGAIDTAGALSLDGVTIADNTTSGSSVAGGGVYDSASNQPNPFTPGGSPFSLYTVLSNVLIADNSGGVDFDYEGNSGGQINDALIGTSWNIPSVIFQTIGYTPFIQGENPLLGPLADHGDGVLTFSLMPGSPALNHGIGAYESYVLDGRGYPFPAYGSDSIGAFQSQPYVVSNTDDSGLGSLRAAITEDDSDLPITFAPNLAGQVISLSSGPITITHNMTIEGLGADEVQVVSGTVAPIPTDIWAGEGNTKDTAGAAPGYPVGTLSYGTGIVGKAFQLNGANAITVPNNQTLDSSSFTVGGWYKIGQSQSSILASKYGGGAYYNGWILGLNGVQPYFQVLSSSSSNVYIASSVNLSLNAWHYIAATYDGNNVALYVDGAKEASGTLAGGYTPSALPMEIGGASWYPAAYTIGLVDQFAFYSSALTANQIVATYDATLSLSQPAYEGYGIFNVAAGVTVSIAGLTLGDGDAVDGGAFDNAGDLTITGTQFVQDSAPAAPAQGQAGNAYGGAIYNAAGGVLVVTDSSFINDAALGGEGQVSGSTAGTGGNAYGGAIYNASGGLLGAADDTFSGDYATGGTGDSTTSTTAQAGAGFGGAIDNAGTAYLVSTTIAGNAVSNGTGAAPSVASDGAGLYNAPGATLDLVNSIVADNTGDDIIVNGKAVAEDTGGNDVVNRGTASGQSNLITSNSGLSASLIVSTADPDLAQLLNTGGTTSTLVELPGSPAIGAGDTAITGLPAFPFSNPGLIAWWQGNGSGQDAVGSANATLNGGANYAPGISGQAFQFNGTSSYVAIPPSADIVGTGGFSVSVWIKTTGADGVIVQQRGTGNVDGEYVLGLVGGKVNFWVFGNGEYDVNFNSNTSVNDGQWHNIVAVRLPNGTGEIFIDGKLDNTQTGPDVSLDYGFNIYIGADERNVYYGDPPDYFSGLIDEVAVFNTALTSSNIQAIDQGTITPESTDQRGDPRTVGGSIDLGAVEEHPYEVTNTNDSGPGSLRQEVADDAAGDQPIIFAPGLDGKTITLTGGPITIKNNLAIEGPGVNDLTIRGGNSSQIFLVDSGNVSISGLTFTGGLGSQGGAIANSGNLTIADCAFSNNVAQDNPSLNPGLDGAGGAIVNLKGASLIVTGTTFSGNKAIGVASSGNNADAYGGAIENVAGATFNDTDDTFYANSVVGGPGGGGFGGAIDNAGTATFVDSTIEENSIASGSGSSPTPSAGAGINNQVGSTLAIRDSIVSYNKGGNDLANASSGTVAGPDIVGLPVTNPAGTPITLTGIPSDAGGATGAGANTLWTISSGTGQQVIAGQDLVFDGSDPITLPSGLISTATALTVNIFFSTTSDGVILGDQDAPIDTDPANSVPVLYVGTDGYLHGGIDGYGMFQSAAPVDDGKTHDVFLSINGSTMTVTIDGTQVAQLSGSNDPLNMTYDQLGTGYGGTAPDAPTSGEFPFTGTIRRLTITQGTALAGSVAPSSSSDDQITFTPPAMGTYTVDLSSTSSGGSNTSTRQTIAATDVAPTPSIGGLPAGGAVNQTYTLAGTVTDPVASDTAGGFNDVWSVSAGAGRQAVAASNLVFNGSNAIALPSGLIHNANSLEITATFQTTGDGVILSYQDQSLGSTPQNSSPLLYIGTNGYLYFAFGNGSSHPIESATQLNDGQLHTVTIQWSGSVLSYTLDSKTSGTISNFTPKMLDMTFDALGTGYTSTNPAAPNGYFPFTGTIRSLTITSGTALLGRLQAQPLRWQPGLVHAFHLRDLHDRPVVHGHTGQHGRDQPVLHHRGHGPLAGDQRPARQQPRGDGGHRDRLRHRDQRNGRGRGLHLPLAGHRRRWRLGHRGRRPGLQRDQPVRGPGQSDGPQLQRPDHARCLDHARVVRRAPGHHRPRLPNLADECRGLPPHQ